MRALIVAFGLLAGGCSLLLDTAEPTQCSTNRDCDGNPSLRGRVCQAGFCVIPQSTITTVSNDAGEGCVSTQICTQANSNQASVCKKAGGACIEWQTPDCPIIEGAWDDPNAIMIGSLMPISVKRWDGTLDKPQYIQREIRAINLAVNEFRDARPQGLPVNGVNRPIAVLHCDTFGDPATAKRMFDHLTDVVGVQAMIVDWDEDLSAVAQQAIDKKIAITCSDCLLPMPPGTLAWPIVAPIAREAPLVSRRVADLEAEIKTARSVSTIKVAVLTEGLRVPKAFTEEFLQKLTFNGKTPMANGDAQFLNIQTEDLREKAPDYLHYANQILQFVPDVVVVSAGQDFMHNVLPLVEAQWPSSPKPHYVMTSLGYQLTPFLDVVKDDDLRKRISGTIPHSSAPLRANVEQYTYRYKQVYNRQDPAGNFPAYDAFYSLALAVAAAANQSLLDGPHISSGFERLVSGPVVDFSPTGLNVALPLLLNQGAVDVRGLLTPLDWNVTTRELNTDIGMYCLGRDDGGYLVMKDDAGLLYSPSTGQITGTYSCD